MRAASSPPSLVTLIFTTALSVPTLNMFLPSLARMSEDFQVDYALVNLSVAGYLAVSAVLQLIVGPLPDRYGRRPILLICMAIFALASVGSVLAETFWVFLGFRLLPAAVVAGPVLSAASLRDRYPPDEAAGKLGHVAMAMALAPMLGPLLGGALDMLFGWRAGFVLYSLLGAVLTLLTGVLVSPANGPFLVLGMMGASSFIGLLAVLDARRVDRRDPLPGTN